MPIFSRAWWDGRDFQASYSEAPLGSGPYKVGDYQFGGFIEFERVADWWADTLPAMVGRYNFDRIRYEYYRDRTASFEAFKKGNITFREEFRSRDWATGYDFPAIKDGRVVKEEVPDGSPVRRAGLVHQHAAAEIRRPARQAGAELRVRLRVDQQEHHVRVSTTGRRRSSRTRR